MNDPIIKINIKSYRNKTRIVFVEEWHNNIVVSNSLALDKMVEWADKELSKWTTAKRLSWDTWQFDSKKEAEKFAVYYNLKWTK